MIAFPSVAAAKQNLAEAERRAAAAQARLAALDAEAAKLDASKASAPAADAVGKILDRQRALRRERRGAEADHNVAAGARGRNERRLQLAEALVARSALDARCAEVAATIGRDYALAAAAIAALMATRWRLQATLQKVEKRMQGPVLRLRETLISPEFCGALRLPNVEPEGLNGDLWYCGKPEQLDDSKIADAVALGEITVEAFAAGNEAVDRAVRAAKTAAAAIVAAYEGHARKIVSLFEIENSLVAEVEAMNQRMNALWPLLTALYTPAQRLTAGRIRTLSMAVFLPAVNWRAEPLWQPFGGWQRRETP